MAKTEIQRDGTFKKITIANGAQTSSACAAVGKALFGIVIPAAFTSTALTFTTSHDGTTYQALSDSTGTAVSLTVAQGKNYDLPSALAPWPYFKIVAGSAEGAARDVYIVMKG